ncbi:MAG TPA: hypothetical protein PKD64_08720 [Pirellulaceae bacterium]|nr:hypothetical protein [Pirellulaceae bacterium]HMO92270.1 hypothetical protein [Pirellulaceae bacterium]HMP70087.1 hypothetical protein [Pirellulaceae bacterium]
MNAQRKILRSIWTTFCFSLALELTSQTSVVNCQVDRWELGRRLQRFEIAWELAPTEQRRKSTQLMQDAVNKFFSLQLRTAARQLDQAWFAVRSVKEPTEFERAAIVYRLDATPVLADVTQSRLSISLQRFYDVAESMPVESLITIDVLQRNGEKLVSDKFLWSEASEGIQLDLSNLKSGDYIVKASWSYADERVDLLETMISRVDDLDKRIGSLKAAAADRANIENDTVRATVRDYLRLFDAVMQDRIQETDYPCNHLISVAEGLLENQSSPSEFVQRMAQQEDLWLTLAEGRKNVVVRLRMPQKVPGEVMPILFLFHGAGGSENMFFETYGAGVAVEAGLQRGWLVVAPRQNLNRLGMNCKELLGVLEDLFSIDRETVAMIGHSMGAGQVIRQASLHPELFAVAAAIGGGGRPSNVADIKDIPWFVAAGEHDFGRNGTRAFNRALEQAAAPNIVYREYPDVEHMVIVQAAATDLFQFFDQALTAHKPAK